VYENNRQGDEKLAVPEVHIGATDAGKFHFNQCGTGLDGLRHRKLFDFQWHFVLCKYGGARCLQLIPPFVAISMLRRARSKIYHKRARRDDE
jgi:hypothetical protein